MDLSEQEVRSLIRDEIRKAFNISNQADIEYLNTKDIAKYLGYKSTRSIYSLIDSGVLRLGKEVQDRRSEDKVKADYWFNKNACLKRLNQLPDKRAK